MYSIEVCSKPIKNSMGFVRHHFVRIPHLQLEIHPGQYKYGTHHTIGFTKRYDYLYIVQVCETCLLDLYTESMELFKIWYYPIINCETLTRGLTCSVPLSYQTAIYAGIVFSSFAILKNCNFVFVAICLMLILFLINNFYQTRDNHACHHLKSIDNSTYNQHHHGSNYDFN